MKSFTKITKTSLSFSVLIFFVLMILSSCNNSGNSKESNNSNPTPAKDSVPPPPKESPFKNAKMELKTYKNDTAGWGYDIIKDDAPYIHQPHKPGVSGVKGFNP